MCVICFKKAGQKMPTKEKVAQCWATNHDGAGVMWRTGTGGVGFAKGFMTLASLQQYLADNDAAFERLDVAIHFRIGTHGGNTAGNTHPFVVGRRADPHRESVRFTPLPVLMHNGVMPLEPRRKDISDSAELALRAAESKRPIAFLKSVDELLHGNRIIVFTGQDVLFFGDAFKKGDDGLLYSNLNHEWSPSVASASLNSGKWKQSSFDQTWRQRLYDDPLDDYDWKPATKEKTSSETTVTVTAEPPIVEGEDDLDGEDFTPEDWLKAELAVAEYYGVDIKSSVQDYDLFVDEYQTDIYFEAERIAHARREREAQDAPVAVAQ